MIRFIKDENKDIWKTEDGQYRLEKEWYWRGKKLNKRLVLYRNNERIAIPDNQAQAKEMIKYHNSKEVK